LSATLTECTNFRNSFYMLLRLKKKSQWKIGFIFTCFAKQAALHTQTEPEDKVQ
jgi:hypothetical protein